MRYYAVHLPHETEPTILSSVKYLHNLPEGTKIEAHITERDGSLIETYEIPIQDGAPQIAGRGKYKPKLVR